MVEVKIVATKTFQYAKKLKIPRSEYERYEHAIESDADDRWFDAFAERYLDVVEDGTDDEFEDVKVNLLQAAERKRG